MKHKFYNEIMAWAEGKPIQYQNYLNWFDLEEGESPNFETPHVNWRIKPETRKYRVALLKELKAGFYYTANDDGYGTEDLENSPNFVKWLTDWIVYEVEE